MKQLLEQALRNKYVMYYHACLPLESVVPALTFEQARRSVNFNLQQYGRDLGKWPLDHQATAIRIMRANWIYQNLGREPIRKPILVHREGNKFHVDCGDTRLMAIKDTHTTVGAIATCLIADQQVFADWVLVQDFQHLVDLCGFDRESVELNFTIVDKDYAVDWFEIGDVSTSHHLHNTHRRLELMQSYLNQQPIDFRFPPDWITASVNWS